MAMTSEERKKELGYGGAAEIARRTGRSRAHVHFVLDGVRRDRKVEVAVARKLQRRVDEVFDAAGETAGAA